MKKTKNKTKPTPILMLGILSLSIIGLCGCAEQGMQPKVVAPVLDTSCPSDGTTSGQVRYEDSLSVETAYGNPVCYFRALTQGQTRKTANTLQTDGSYSAAEDLPCTESGTKWQVECVSKQDAYTGVVSDEFVAVGSTAQVDVVGQAFDTLQFKVEDKVTGGQKYFDISGCGTTGTGWHAFTGAQCVAQNNAGTGTSLTLAADDYIWAWVYLKTNHTKHVFGEEGLNVWLLVDADTSSWQEPETKLNNGAMIINAKSELANDDKRKYNDNEYAYLLGQFNGRSQYIDFYLRTVEGVNPSTGVDPILEICSEGRYNSAKDKDTVKIGCWTDTSSQTQVTTTLRQYFKFDVS